MFPKQALRHHQFGGFAIEAHAVCPVDRSATLLHAMSRQRIVLHGLAGVYAALAVDLPPEGGSVGCAAHAVALDGVGDGFAGKAGAQPGDEVVAPGLRLLAGAAHLLVVGGLSPRPLPKRGSWLRDVCKPPLREGVGGGHFSWRQVVAAVALAVAAPALAVVDGAHGMGVDVGYELAAAAAGWTGGVPLAVSTALAVVG